MIGPAFKHDCDACTFLGTYDEHDLYHCVGPVHQVGPTVIARWSDHGPDYASGMQAARRIPMKDTSENARTLRALRVAYLIAQDLELPL